MDFHEYWDLIPSNEKYESIGQEIVRYKRNLYDSETSSRDLSEEVICFFQKHLLECPYPTQNIIFQIIDLKNHEKNQILEEIILNTIVTLIDLIIENPQQLDKRFKLLNLLSNVYVSDYSMQKVSGIIVPAIYDLKENRGLLDDALYFALLSRSSRAILDQYLEYERERLLEKPISQKFFFLRCYHQRKHWIECILNADNDSVIKKHFNENLYNHIVLYRIILKMDKNNFVDDPTLSDEFNQINVIENNEVLNLCMSELARQNKIAQFMKTHSSDRFIDMSKSFILTQLLNANNFKMENYEKILNLLNQNHHFNELQEQKFQKTIQLKTEMQLFNEYMVIKSYLSHIIQTQSSEGESIDASLNNIRGVLKTINDGNVLLQLLKTVFTLIFIRCEHIRKTKFNRRRSETYLGLITGQNNSCSTEISDNVDIHRNGFLCGKECLEAILNSLRLFLMSLDVTEAYKNSDSRLREEFSAMLKSVDNALWRLRIVTENTACTSTKKYSAREWLAFYEHENIPKMTSDEDCHVPKRKATRKRLKRRSRIVTKSSDENDEDSENDNHFITESTHTELSENRVKYLESHKRCESIIPKLIMKPESLVALCIINNDSKNLEGIIKEYRLEDSNIASEVRSLTNFQESLASLNTIAIKYETIYDQHEPKESTVDYGEIKTFAEAGFEVAKMLNVLDNYCDQNDMKHLEENEILLQKTLTQHPNLWMYQKEFVKISSLIDFMITLPTQFELNQNILKFIMKKFGVEEKDGFYVTLLKNLIEIQTLLQHQGRKLSICEIFNQEISSLEPSKFKLETENRKNLKWMLETNIDSLNDESTLLEIDQEMQLFKSDVNYIDRIINYVKNVRFMTKFHTNEFYNINDVLAHLNISNVIGKIVFINQYNPENLTNFAFNSNINLLHSIALAGAGEILPPSNNRKEEEKLLSLFYLNQTGSKHEMVFDDIKKDEIYTIKNTDILYYVKKSSFLVAYLVKEIQGFNYKTLKYDEEINFFKRLEGLEMVADLKCLFENNSTLTALNYDSIELKILLAKMEKLELNEKLRILACITERNWRKNKNQLNELRDSYLEMLIEKEPQNIISLLNEIGSVKKFCELLLKNIHLIHDDEEAERLLGWCLCIENLLQIDDHQKEEIERWMLKLKIYREILQLFKNDAMAENNMDWMKIKDTAENSTSTLVNYLLNININHDLCYELLRVHPLSSTRSDETYKIFINALNRKERELNFQHTIKIIHTFSAQQVNEFFDYSLHFINNLPSMSYVLNFLSTHVLPTTPSKTLIRRQKFQVSCRIIENLDADDSQLWSLAEYPLILLEQLLMNSKIEVLNVIVKELRALLMNEPSCNVCSNTSKNYHVGETLVYDYDAHHKNMWISSECIDFVLKMYAAKALDFQIVEFNSTLSEVQSFDSSLNSKVFQMPKEIPTKDKWVADDEAKVCMCCKKSKFSLLNRRHHCRRCGRVVCAECSSHLVLLPELYNALMVRCCDECYQQLEEERKRAESGSNERTRSADLPMEWKLSGDLLNDQMIRDEFNFEHSPNVNLCIAIICLHTINDDLTKFLLFHCHRLELLLRPVHGKINLEVDIVLVAKMLKYLATTAKLFGDMGESNIIIDHADMVLKVAENECDAIISKVPFSSFSNSFSIRDIINELIKAENWKLALELSVKWDRFSTSGVFSAWAVTLIKGGQHRLAREKMALALQPVGGSSSKSNEEMIAMINFNVKIDPLKFTYKRPMRSSPLLFEILEILESTASKKNVIEISMASSASSRLATSREGVKNLNSTMENLKKIMEGDYGEITRNSSVKFDWQQNELLKSPYYEESIFYLIAYAANNDILDFFVRNNLIKHAVRYAIIQNVPYETFTQLIFMPVTRSGRLAEFMELIKQNEVTHWRKDYIVAICKYLERKKSLHVLYQIQILTNDYIRASMTSIKFYLEGSGNYTELNEKARHLNDAKNHLQTELEQVEQGVKHDENVIHLKWDSKAINAQINAILLQLEASKFLAKCEANGLPTLDVMPKVFMDKISLKTLLGKPNEMNQVAILLLICGQSICGGFGLCYRIIQECSLKPVKIYTTCTKYLARDLNRLMEVEKLVNCIKTNASSSADCNDVDEETKKLCDELVALAVEIAYTQHQAEAKTQIDQLIKIISSKIMKIQCYINSNQLKTAFVICASMNNFEYIKRIMKQAEITRQENIRRLCEKKLIQHQNVMTRSGISMSGSTMSSIGDISDLLN